MTEDLSNHPVAPDTLNGFPVIEQRPRRGGGTVVLVDRGPRSLHRWVVASWNRGLGDSWVWGHYIEDVADAFALLDEKTDTSAAAAFINERNQQTFERLMDMNPAVTRAGND